MCDDNGAASTSVMSIYSRIDTWATSRHCFKDNDSSSWKNPASCLARQVPTADEDFQLLLITPPHCCPTSQRFASKGIPKANAWCSEDVVANLRSTALILLRTCWEQQSCFARLCVIAWSMNCFWAWLSLERVSFLSIDVTIVIDTTSGNWRHQR